MSTTAMKVLDRAEHLGMLEPKVIVELRRQVTEMKFHVSAEAIVKLLVDKKHLTQFQAKKLVAEVTEEPAAGTSSVEPAVAPAAPAKKGHAPEESDDNLINFNDPPSSATSGSPRGSSAHNSASPEEEIVDLEAALPPAQPLRAAVKPVAPAAAGTKQAPGTQLPPAAAKRPVAAGDEIVPLEPATPGSAPAAVRRDSKPTPSAVPAARANVPPLRPDAAVPPAFPPANYASGGLTPLGPANPWLDPAPLPGNAPSLADFGPLGPMNPLDDAGLLSEGLTVVAVPPGANEAAPHLRKKTARGWDSPLLLLGGGGVGVLIIAFVILYFALTRGSAQQILDEALEAYRSGSYATAIQLYQKFASKYPDDPNRSLARVKIGMARIHQHYDGAKDMSRALEAAQTVLPEIEQEPNFDDARPELESMLPSIADRFASEARAATDVELMEARVALAHDAMKLVNNASYLPSSRRKNQQSRIEAIEEKIRVAERTINQDKALASALEELQAKLKSGDITAAYQVRETLLQSYPNLAKNSAVIGTTLEISQRERDLVTVSMAPQAAATDDVHRPPHPQVTLSQRQGDTLAVAADAHAYVLVQGAVYAIDAASGALRWRRFVGFDTHTPPVPLGGGSRDVLVTDARHHELLRLEGATGKALWRQELGEPFTLPVVHNDRVFVALRSGSVAQIDAASGELARRAQLSQEATVSPGLDARKKLLYQPANHSTLFGLAAEESAGDPLSCQFSYYLGHRPGSIVVPPMVLVGYVFVFENTGVDSSRVHVLAQGEEKPLERVGEPYRMRGQITVSPALQGRRLVVVSNLGDTMVFDVDPNNAESPVAVAAKMVGGLSQPTSSYPLLTGSRLLIADKKLADYEVQATRQSLDRGSSTFDGDTFLAPLQLFNNVLVHVRQRHGARAVTATGVDLSGNASWQLELAAPVAGVFAFPQERRFAAVTSNGDLFDVSLENLKQGLRGEPTASGRGSASASYGRATPLPEGKYLFAEQQGRSWLLYDPATGGGIRKVDTSLPGLMSTPPVPFAGGVLAPMSEGSIWLLDTTTGKPQDNATPFQPEIAPGTKAGWLPPLAVDDHHFVAFDAERRKLYLGRREEKPHPFLAEVRHIDLDYEPVAAALVGKTVLVVARRESRDEILSYAFPALTVGKSIPLEGRVSTSGLRGAGTHAFCESGNGQLLLLSETGELIWQVDLQGNALAGLPLRQGENWVAVCNNGEVLSLDGATGESKPATDAGQPLLGQAQLFGSRLIAGGADGTLHILSVPGNATEQP
jgi:outer membrane protein assembly factor BamB